MYKMNFSTQHLRDVFSEDGKYESFKKLTYDLNHGNDIYEYNEETGESRKISRHDANKAVRKVLMEVAELSEEDLKSKKTYERKMKKHADEIFELIEEDIEFKVETGFRENEWFQKYVDYRNEKLGDDTEFWTKDAQGFFVVAKISGDHHDLTMQHLNGETPQRVHTNKYGIKVGKDIDLIMLGRVDFTAFTDKVAASFVNFVLTLTFAEIFGVKTKIPTNSQFNKTGVLSSSTKPAFDTLIEDVETANGSAVMILGTKTALKKLNNLADVNWISNGQKEDVANMGRLGSYEGTEIIEVPQRFALNDVTTKLIPTDTLLILPINQEGWVKVVDKGEVQTVERGEQKADLADDFRTYEMQRELGVGTMLGNYIGCWTF